MTLREEGGAGGAAAAAAAAARDREIFRKGSTTYSTASLFFPPALRDEVGILYSFVRVADDYVDATPQDGEGFRAFRLRWDLAAAGKESGDPIVDRYAALAARRGFEPAWTEAFLDAMEADLSVREYEGLEAVLRYIHGSAEVIGLFMSRLMGLPREAEGAAARLGRSMQYVNFIRDFDEDRRLGRRYLPLEGADPRVSDPVWSRAHPEEFAAFLRPHIARFEAWAAEGEAGYRFIPWRYRVPIATAQDMYRWTARRIEREPLLVFERKVKPRKARIVLQALLNLGRLG